MKKMRKVIALMTAVLMMASAACSSGDSKPESSKAESNANSISSTVSESTADSEDDKTEETGNNVEVNPQIEIWAGYVRDFAEFTSVQEQWKEELGYDVLVKNVVGDVDTSLNLLLAGGELPDMMVTEKKDVYNTSIVRSKLVMEVDDILADDKYPNLSSIPQQYLDMTKDENGVNWYIPTSWDIDPENPWPGWTRNAFYIDKTVLEKTGISADDIKTLDDYVEFLRAAKEIDNGQGGKLIPTTYSDDEFYQTVLTAFGLKTGESGGVTSVDKKGDEFTFLYDQPQYKEAIKWMNMLIREGLMDEESVIQKTDLRREKLYSGMYASIIGFENFDSTAVGDPYRNFEPIPFPLAEGVEEPGLQFLINPYPKASVYISKDTDKLDAVLDFMNWALEPLPERNFELNEGIVGFNWDWIDQPYGAWDFTPEYDAARSNPTTRSTLQPEMYMLGTISDKWYPWWTRQQPEDAAQYIHVRYNDIVREYGTNGIVNSWDFVSSEEGGVWDQNGATLKQVVKEDTAKMLLSKSDEEFEQNWTLFEEDLETRAHWSELKEEWHTLYEKQIAVTGEW